MMHKRVLYSGLVCLLIVQLLHAHQPTVLVGSPIRQKPAILHEFLDSLERLPQSQYRLHYYFIDDNEIPESSALLQQFCSRHQDVCTVICAEKSSADMSYHCTEKTHAWTESLVWKVAAFKDSIIAHARASAYEYLFLIDSDIVLHPRTLEQLLIADKDIISNIFWTRWQPDAAELPQVWLSDVYNLYASDIGEKLTDHQKQERTQQFLGQLRIPGVYEVGGLGACTLLSARALAMGVNFSRINNLLFWGEDRHFCVRAHALGISLFVDTHYPAYHIYRESALPGVALFKHQCAVSKIPSPRITLSMIVKNEADRYLRQVLDAAKAYITDAVIIDDGSTDDTVAVCKEVLAGIPLYIVENRESKFHNEVELRRQQWQETLHTNPDWIVTLDADEIFESKFAHEVLQLIQDDTVDAYYFRLYDFWDETHYRDDALWCAHHYYRPFLIRHRPDTVSYQWHEAAQHCGRFPREIRQLPYALSHLRLKHYGWANPHDRLFKYGRYKRLDPDGAFGSSAHYESILDENPHLTEWVEDEGALLH